VFFWLLEEVAFEELWYFAARENGAVLAMTCHSSTASACGSFARHFSASSGLF
jgi:hypothetical protein